MSRNLVVCIDGTRLDQDSDDNNMVKLIKVMRKNRDDQIVYYDPSFKSKANYISNLFSQAEINRKIEKAYQYLVYRYNPGDKIFLFGLGDASSIICGIAKILGTHGVLKYEKRYLLREVIKFDRHGFTTFEEEEKYCYKVQVNFIGAWDLLDFSSLLGFDYYLSSGVKKVFHAISIDEKRLAFRPLLCEQNQYVEQVWFSGVLGDIIGWYQEKGLSDISFEWILNKAREEGFFVDTKKLKLESNCLAPMHNSLLGWHWLRKFRKRIRKIPIDSLIHSSVIERMNFSDYKPRNLPEKYKCVD